ncbi:TonB-dependent receptor [Spirosoma montaniterrae]|uniref:TonB-dependent receptor n=1 Tax=Spirosoma montaniterrae TaxID=1178516 RepID=A0A1P9X3V1_9BACT|nr:TonB-dependent receptor [Spirosoma montaniterrae]
MVLSIAIGWPVVQALAQSDSTNRAVLSADSVITPEPILVQGIVSELNNGRRVPLTGATVRWLSTSVGAVTDSLGRFQLPLLPAQNRLVVSYVGYQPDTLTVTNPATQVAITLRAAQTLNEVTVTGAPGQIDPLNPIQTELITQRTLAKAACCNLSESFETNASVSVSYSDAVTGAKQIQFLGLGGQYVQTNVENIPTVRGLATTFGLNYIPGTWITSIDIGKGAGSVVNGYESMSGQMNVELQKPDSPDRLFLNGYVNSFGRAEGNVNWSKPLNKRWSMGVLGHASTLQTERDQNRDGFRDLPLYTQVNAVNRFKYSGERFMAQFGVKALYEDRNGGQLSRFGESRYAFLNTTKRVEFFSKTARLYPEKPYKGLGLILNGLYHDQTARFGLTPYTGQQRSLYGNLIYQNIIGTTSHAYKAGLSYVLDDYQEQYASRPLLRRESVPGAFLEYTYTYLDKLTLVLGGRLDYLSVSGQRQQVNTTSINGQPHHTETVVLPNQWAQWQATPRLHLRYQPTPNQTLRLSAGRGFRMPNQLAENMGYLVSSRRVNLNYDVRPEVSWNYGASLTNDFRLWGKKASVVLDYYRTDFQNQLVVDLEHPTHLYFYNLQGRSFANSFQAELNVQPARRFDLKAAYRRFDVQQSMGRPGTPSQLLPRMMIARDRVLLNAGYALPYDKWKFDATFQWNGPRRIPYLREGVTLPGGATMPLDYAPGFANLNAQVSRAFRSGWEVYVGGENLTGFRQLDPIIAPANPFGPGFDAGARAWGPITGQMIYVGFRFKPPHQ